MRTCKRALACALAFIGMIAITARADVSMNATRITAPDTDALAAFYKSAFGMFEVQRIAMGGGAEIMLNFGKTEAAARANPGSQLVLFPREANLPEDTTAHLIVNVTDMATTVAAIKAAGGNMEREPFGYGDTGMLIGMGIDPAGNHFEMLYFPPAP